MLYLLAALALLLTAADHWTTYLCLRAPVEGWIVTEANPVADWLFTQAGLLPGLMIDTGITLGAVAFLLLTDRISHNAKYLCFGLIATTTAYAVLNNVNALEALGLSATGTGTGIG